MADEERIHYVQREFEPTDVEGMALAFAATSRKKTNYHVLRCCRANGVLCCPVDGSWPHGDFVTPATFRRDGVTVSVSTGGKSCRKARLVREQLAHHMDVLHRGDVLIIGTSHRLLPLERREPYHLPGDRMETVGNMLAHVLGVQEFLIINTCNRVEMVGVVADGSALLSLVTRILGFEGLSEQEYYAKHGYDAFQHLALVTSGMLSQSPGEDHIVAQVKDSLRDCETAGWADGIMRALVDSALHLSKDIRLATAPLLQCGEIEDVCMESLAARRPSGDWGRVLVLGSGIVGRGVVQRLAERGHSCDWFYHRNRPRLPQSWQGTVHVRKISELDEHLSDADVIICAVSTPAHALDATHARLLAGRSPRLIFDLGIPRNVDPELVRVAANIDMVDLDDLKQVRSTLSADVTRATEVAVQLVADHREMYDKIRNSLQGRDARQ
jgi:glutamyl-tRNA reductase